MDDKQLREFEKAFANIKIIIIEAFGSLIEQQLHNSIIEFSDFENKQMKLLRVTERKSMLHRIDFSKQKVRHQVIDSKPKHLIKKIIR